MAKASPHQKKKTLTSFKIQGITYKTPEPPKYSEVEGHDLPADDQIFRRPELPTFMNKLSRSGDKIVWTPEQSRYLEKEYDKCKFSGHWVVINGVVTYITPLHYFYLSYYVLEDGNRPEYRDVDRRFFYFLEYCLKIGYIKGIVRLKKRREGATSQTCCWLLWTAIFFPYSNCGIVSKTGEDAETAYKTMVLAAWNELPPFFKPEHDRYTGKKINLKKQSKKEKEEGGEEFTIKGAGGGLNSSISYKNTTLTSYDSGRLTAMLMDETTKWGDLNVLEYLPKVLKTMMQGTKRVGFAMLPSSMNQLDKGGRNFRDLYVNSNQMESKDGRTQTGLYKYFVEAWDGFPGFIGKFGESIIMPPSRKQLKWLTENWASDQDLTLEDLKLGAKAYLEKKRAELTNPILIAESKRSEPFNEDEVLYDGDTNCYFSAQDIQNQIKEIDKNPPYIRTGRLYEDENNKVRFRDDPQGNWHWLEFPDIAIQNAVNNAQGYGIPMFSHEFKIGCDPYRNTHAEKGSNGCIVIMKNFDPINPHMGGYPIAYYRGRPKYKKIFYKEVYMACRFCSCRACIESDVDDFYEHFRDMNAKSFCAHTPSTAIDPQLDAKKKLSKQREFGVKSADEFARNKQLEVAQMYMDNFIGRIKFKAILEDAYGYDHEKRTKSDLTIALFMALLLMTSFIKGPDPEPVKIPFSIPTWDLSKQVAY